MSTRKPRRNSFRNRVRALLANRKGRLEVDRVGRILKPLRVTEYEVAVVTRGRNGRRIVQRRSKLATYTLHPTRGWQRSCI